MPDYTSIHLNWLRETAPGHLEADLGLRVSGDSLPLALMSLHPAQQRQERDENRIYAQLDEGLRSLDSLARLPEWQGTRMKNFFGPITSQAELQTARQNLGVTRRVCESINRTARQAGGDAEVHLPYFGRKAWLRRFELLNELAFDIAADGRMVNRIFGESSIEDSASQVATALAPAFLKTARQNFTVAFQDHQRTTAENARVALDQVLADYGLEGALDGHSGQIEITLVLRVPADACNAWMGAPVGRSGDFIPTYSAFSAGIQRALRRWLGWFYFGDGSRYGELNSAYAMLAYQVTRPYIANTRSAFAYDVMDAAKMGTLCRAAARRLGAKLAAVEAHLYQAGHFEASGMYAPERATKISGWLERDGRLFPSLLAGDGGMVDESLKLAQRINLCLRAQQFSRSVQHFVTVFDRKLRAMLRRSGVLESVAPLLLAETIGALSQARGGIGPELVLRLASETRTSTHRANLVPADNLCIQ